MAKVEFDAYGNPRPYDFIELTLQEFKDIFVDGFNPRERREYLFKVYIKYIKDFFSVYGQSWEQWLDGSYTTKKENPNDIDGVGLIDGEFAIRHQEEIKKFFRIPDPYIKDVMDEYGLDMYLIPIYPENDERHRITLNRIKYWKEWFSKDRQGRPKGIIKLMVDANEL
ncbi:DUF6932 family protein [Persephonella sp.]